MNINQIMKRILSFLRKILPMRLVEDCGGLYGMLKLPTFSYAQKGEDILIDCFFNRKNNGYYLDVGCFHPKWISNTYLLHKKGWTGTAVDLEEHKLRFYKKIRGEKVNVIKAAVVGKVGSDPSVMFYKFESSFGWSDVDTLDTQKASEWAERHSKSYDLETVKTLHINELLSGLPPVDFLNVDIEGLDLEVIEAIDLNRFRIKAILFEVSSDFDRYQRLVPRLVSFGYEHLFDAGNSICFALKD